MSGNDAIVRLLARDHHDPHAVLGAHPHPDGVLVRVLRPGARTVSVLLHDDAVELRPVVAETVFEGVVRGATFPVAYRLLVHYADGAFETVDDPYRFGPTLGDVDLHLIGEGRHERLACVLGAHEREIDGVRGTSFTVWAPSARAASVVGDFNYWNPVTHPMRSLGASGVWELFLPGAGPGSHYKFAIRGADGTIRMKADPLAQWTETPPRTASIVFSSRYRWSDDVWRERRRASRPWREPMSIYEVHPGSWRQGLGYRELAEQLADHVNALGFTHVELLPIMEHPFSGSWGYQVTGFFAPTSRFGTPDDFRAFVDILHGRDIGVILDWVPAHFPRDDFALARFDGSALYEHADPRRGEHPDWGTLVFNYGRNEVRNFLLASALTWLRDYHADGLRVDAVASMLYLDYSRKEGEWVANERGGREDLQAIEFLREMNELVHRDEPGVISAAEESTAWTGVSRPTDVGGLGFGFKWNMGWMHDTLGYFSRSPVHRRFHHNELTFSMVYAFSENFILPLSHDEVVHGKGSLLWKMPGDRWQQLANLRSLYGYMWAHPGKQLLFMGGELAQPSEWNHDSSIEWHLLEHPEHAGVMRLVADLNRRYRAEPALWELDHEPGGFVWLEADDADHNVLAFARRSADGRRWLVCACNLSPVPRHGYRLGLPAVGPWREVMNTDSRHYGGSDVGNGGVVRTEPVPAHGQACSAPLELPPLGTVWLVPEATAA
jgi:1,4-alpha-glucan branching enzyme